MPKQFHVMLTDQQRSHLQRLVSAGQSSARTILRAHILLKADTSPGAPAWSDSQIAAAFDVAVATVERTRKHLHERGFEQVLVPKKPDRLYTHKIDDHAEKVLLATTATDPPDGQSRWTLKLLANKLIELQVFESVSRETVRKALKKKRAQAVVGQAVGHRSQARPRLRGSHGRRAKSL